MTDLGHGKNERFAKIVELPSGIKDDNVTPAINIGDSSNTSFDTTNQTIVGAVNEANSKHPSGEKQIFFESDLPAPVGGIITLENFSYSFNGLVSISNKLAPPTEGVVNLKPGTAPGGILYTGGIELFTGFMGIKTFMGFEYGLFLTATSGGKLFNITGDSSAQILMTENISTNVSPSSFTNFESLGTVQNIAITIQNSNFTNIGGGLELINVRFISFFRNVIENWENNPNTYILRATTNVDLFKADSNDVQLGSNEYFVDIDGTLGQGSIINNYVTPTANFYFPGSKKQDYVNLLVQGNIGVADSTVTAQFRLSLNSAETIIPEKDAWVIMNYTSAETFLTEERMVGLTDGGVKYQGLENVSIAGDGNINLVPTTPGKELETSFMSISAITFVVEFDYTINIVNRVAHGLSENQTISFKLSDGTLPAELRKDVMYVAVNVNPNYFQLAYYNGGSPINFTDNGSGSLVYSQLTIEGGVGKAYIAGNAIDLIPQALMNLQTNKYIYVFIRNLTDAVNIIVMVAYYRLRK